MLTIRSRFKLVQPNPQSAPKKRTRIQAENEATIVACALEVFVQHGYRGATVDRIATAAGMSKANVLYYFKRKDDIYVAVLENTLATWLDPLKTLDPSGDPQVELANYIRAKLVMSKTCSQASRLFANEILRGAPYIKSYLENQLKALVDEKCTVIRHWIDSGKLIPIAPVHLLFLIWSSTQHYADFAPQVDVLHDGDEETLYADAQTFLTTVILRGLKP